MAFRTAPLPGLSTAKLSFRLEIDASPMVKLFRELSPALHRRHARRALEKAGKPLAAAIRKEVRAISTDDSTGILGKSIGSVARTHRTKLRTTLVVGAIRKPEVEVSLKTATGRGVYKKKRVVKRKASRYFHLSAPRRDGEERVQRLFSRHKSEMESILVDQLEWGLMKELARLKQKQHDSK